jgi:hypothetical protein
MSRSGHGYHTPLVGERAGKRSSSSYGFGYDNDMSFSKLNLRDLFWLVLIVALAVGWWLDRRSQEQRLSLLENVVGRKPGSNTSVAELIEINQQLGGDAEQTNDKRLRALLKDEHSSPSAK